MGESAEIEVRPFYHRLTARLQRIPGYKILVLDSAYDFVRFIGRAKIDEDAVNYFIKVVLQGICDETNSTLLIPWYRLKQVAAGTAWMDGLWPGTMRRVLALHWARIRMRLTPMNCG